MERQGLAVGVNDDIDESARPFFDRLKSIVHAIKGIGLWRQMRKIENADAGHFSHELTFAGGKPIRSLEMQAAVHESERLDLQRFGQRTYVDDNAATFKAA